MRFTIAYYLIFIYIAFMFRPFIPEIKDVISHTFCETIHIATVHALYGSNHAQAEMAKATSEGNDNKHTNGNTTNQNSIEQLYTIPAQTMCNNYSSVPIFMYFYINASKARTGFIIKFPPPPKASC